MLGKTKCLQAEFFSLCVITAGRQLVKILEFTDLMLLAVVSVLSNTCCKHLQNTKHTKMETKLINNLKILRKTNTKIYNSKIEQGSFSNYSNPNLHLLIYRQGHIKMQVSLQ